MDTQHLQMEFEQVSWEHQKNWRDSNLNLIEKIKYFKIYLLRCKLFVIFIDIFFKFPIGFLLFMNVDAAFEYLHSYYNHFQQQNLGNGQCGQVAKTFSAATWDRLLGLSCESGMNFIVKMHMTLWPIIFDMTGSLNSILLTVATLGR